MFEQELFNKIFPKAYFITFPNAKCVPRKPLSKEVLDSQFIPRIDFSANDEAFYTGYYPNDHHIKTTYIWENYIKKICDICELPFNKNDFNEVKYFSEDGKFNLSYHEPKDKNNTSFKYIDINMFETYGTFDILRLTKLEAEGKYKNPLSRYHNLFYGYHSCARIYNNNPITDKKILLVCDSMMIPIIPILAYYCKELTVVDNRERKPWLKNFKEHDYDKVIISRILCDFTIEDITFRFH